MTPTPRPWRKYQCMGLKPESEILDDTINELKRAEAQRDDILTALKAFLAKWALVQPHIDSAFILRQVRSGVEYDGPNVGAELETLRALVAHAEDRTP